MGVVVGVGVGVGAGVGVDVGVDVGVGVGVDADVGVDVGSSFDSKIFLWALAKCANLQIRDGPGEISVSWQGIPEERVVDVVAALPPNDGCRQQRLELLPVERAYLVHADDVAIAEQDRQAVRQGLDCSSSLTK